MRLLAILLMGITLSACQTESGSSSNVVEGYIDLHRNTSTDQLVLDIPKDLGEVLYYNGFARGLGSNDIGLDRGLLGSTMIVTFEQAGDRLLLRENNLMYRGSSDNPEENRAIDEAFPDFIMWQFPIISEDDDSWTVDATAFAKREIQGVSNWLSSMGQGDYAPDEARSAIFWPNTKTFEGNLEIEAMVTYTGSGAGGYLRDVASNSEGFSLHIHHSFLRLPDDQYQPRAYHPAGGMFATQWKDYTVDLDKPLTQRLINRHRLVKADPSAAVSDPVEPIIYYLDPGAPEPVKTALIEGGNWWADAFEAAGFSNAFRVEILPEGADPMDARYNVINWVHRATRGWSYGYSISDPRTGEILKGHVTLGSLRVRQDILIAEALLNEADAPEAQEMALARIRQLSAHEIGHTIGVAHNFAASPSDRASVMDYPHPLFEMSDGQLSLTNAYAEGIGEWDKLVIAYGYGDNPDAAIANILESGIKFVSDADARPIAGAYADGHLWDNHAHPVHEYERLLELRSAALEKLSVDAIAADDPIHQLDHMLVPIYNMARYQADAVAKQIGGFNIQNTMADEHFAIEAVDVATQQQATLALLASIDAEQLTLPASLKAQLIPVVNGYFRTRESSPSQNAEISDNAAMAEAYARHVFARLLAPARLNRLTTNDYSLSTHLDTIISALYSSNAKSDAISNRVELIGIQMMKDTLNDSDLNEEAKTILWSKLNGLNESIAVNNVYRERIKAMLGSVGLPSASDAQTLPPGSPI